MITTEISLILTAHSLHTYSQIIIMRIKYVKKQISVQIYTIQHRHSTSAYIHNKFPGTLAHAFRERVILGVKTVAIWRRQHRYLQIKETHFMLGLTRPIELHVGRVILDSLILSIG